MKNAEFPNKFPSKWEFSTLRPDRSGLRRAPNSPENQRYLDSPSGLSPFLAQFRAVLRVSCLSMQPETGHIPGL
jgi:hypothetical protein